MAFLLRPNDRLKVALDWDYYIDFKAERRHFVVMHFEGENWHFHAF